MFQGTDGSNAVKMAGTWTVEGSSHFTADTTGRITYNGERPFKGPIDCTVNAIMTSGGSVDIASYIAIGGVVKRQTEFRGEASSSTSAGLSSKWQHTFNNGDFADIFLERQSGSANIVGVSGIIRIN